MIIEKKNVGPTSVHIIKFCFNTFTRHHRFILLNLDSIIYDHGITGCHVTWISGVRILSARSPWRLNFRMVVPGISASSVWYLLHVALLAPRIWRWLLDFWKSCAIWYHHTYRCDDTTGCIVQFWPPDDERMCSKHVEAWNKIIIKFSASSWLILINKGFQMKENL